MLPRVQCNRPSTHHVNGDFANFGCAMCLTEVLDAFLLLRDLVGENALQVGAVGGNAADRCDEARPVFLSFRGEIEDVFK